MLDLKHIAHCIKEDGSNIALLCADTEVDDRVFALFALRPDNTLYRLIKLVEAQRLHVYHVIVVHPYTIEQKAYDYLNKNKVRLTEARTHD